MVNDVTLIIRLSDRGYNDLIVQLRGITPVPAPQQMTLAGRSNEAFLCKE